MLTNTGDSVSCCLLVGLPVGALLVGPCLVVEAVAAVGGERQLGAQREVPWGEELGVGHLVQQQQ